jgi:hypothetical protein
MDPSRPRPSSSPPVGRRFRKWGRAASATMSPGSSASGCRTVPRPGAVTLDAGSLAELYGLAGVSLEATVKLGKMSFTAALLFTHRGLSGPAILQISSFWSVREPLTIDFLPGTDVFAHLKVGKKSQPKKEISTVLAQRFRRRLAQRIVAMTERDGCLADTSDRTLGRIASNVNAWRVTPARGPRATGRRRLPSAESIPRTCRQKPWRPDPSPGSISSARSSM